MTFVHWVLVAAWFYLGFAGIARSATVREIKCYPTSTDPHSVNLWTPAVGCAKVNLEVDALKSGVEPKTTGLVEGTFYGGLHFGSLVALHTDLRGRVRQSSLEEAYSGSERSTRNLFLAIGNPSTARFRLLLGQFYLPLGLGLSEVMPIIRDRYTSERYFATTKPAAALSIWDGFGTILDLSVSGDRRRSGIVADAKELAPGFGFRLSHDISPLSGTKLVVTYYEDLDNEKRFGLAALNETPTGGRSSIEWLRLNDLHHAGHYDFHQLIRFNYDSGMAKPRRWIFEYEDELEDHYLTTLGVDERLMEALQARFAVGYFRHRFDRSANHWLGTIGMRSWL